MTDIENIPQLVELIQAGETDWSKYGHVVAKRKGDLILFNYTSLAAVGRRWNWFERNARGLILNAVTGAIVARPFEKFFNWGEFGVFPEEQPVEIMEKMDGSLGITYIDTDGSLCVATRGSFDSDQALWATEMLRKHLMADLIKKFVGEANTTLLFEIIYPENRIVVDYRGMEDLILIGMRGHDGTDYFMNSKVNDMVTVNNFAALYHLAAPRVFAGEEIDWLMKLKSTADYNTEGWVLRYADGTRLKVKTDAYLRIHRLIARTSFKNTLAAMAEGTLDEFIEGAPDEFLIQIKEWREEIADTVDGILFAVNEAFEAAPKGEDRKVYAMWVKENHPDLFHYMFARLDGKDVESIIFKKAFEKRIKEEKGPSGDRE